MIKWHYVPFIKTSSRLWWVDIVFTANNQCASSPCLNNSTCLNTVTGYICSCPTEWKGIRCQLSTAECKYCVNARSCTHRNNNYVCECMEGWSGHNCDSSKYKLWNKQYNLTLPFRYQSFHIVKRRLSTEKI